MWGEKKVAKIPKYSLVYLNPENRFHIILAPMYTTTFGYNTQRINMENLG